ncbi:MAG: right-handed parallel beta-helix repeat-containing protein, partial [Chloroflexi bacterium]|nr:right-handed parallel beta-helix repeat-containing protein [Chloroflexota bacterium]
MLARNPYPLLLRLLAALFLAVSALPLATPPTAFAATRQVAKTGSADTGACTGTPCLTITYAISQATAGDAITVGAGTYNERFTIDRHLTLTGAGVGSTIINGQASGRVVFVNLGVTATITGVTLTNGSSNTVGGGGIYNDGTLTVQNSAISGNTSEATGGGIANYGGLTIQNSTIAGNSAPNDAGGGICNDGQLTVQNSTLSGNSATDGGGIYNGIEATFIGSAITGNHASSDDAGGGLQIIGMLTLQNSTVSGNTASGADSAGAMRVAGAAVVTIISSTIANNDGAVGGIKQTTGTVTLKRSIVASQQAGTNCSGTITDGGHNLVGSGSNCGLTNGVNGNVVTATPLLGALAGNGGSTQTIALQTGSPAINAVPTGSCLDKDNAALTQDQRGSPRPVGGACDMGAFEVQGADPTPPTCVLTSGPTLVSGHTQIQVTVQDTGSGLQTIASVGTTNATLSGNTGFTVGSTSARVVTATKTVEGQTARVLLQVTD